MMLKHYALHSHARVSAVLLASTLQSLQPTVANAQEAADPSGVLGMTMLPFYALFVGMRFCQDQGWTTFTQNDIDAFQAKLKEITAKIPQSEKDKVWTAVKNLAPTVSGSEADCRSLRFTIDSEFPGLLPPSPIEKAPF